MKKFTKIGPILLVMLLAVALLITGCGQKETAEGTSKVLTIGVDLPLTGSCAKVGTEFKDACTMAFDEIGNQIGDYKVKLVWIDDQADPEKATRAYEQAVQKDKIDVGILNWNSSVAVALMEVVAKYQIPHFFPTGNAAVVNEKWQSNEKYRYWVTKTWASPDKLSLAYIYTINQAVEKGLWKPRNKKVVIYGEDNDYCRGFGSSLAQQFKDAGWEVVGEEWIKTGETDMYPILTKFKSLDASIVAGSISGPASMAAFIKQAREVNLKSLMICDALGDIGEWYKLTGNAADYVLDNRPIFTSEKGKKFAADFKAKYGYEPSAAAAGLQYDAARFFIKLANETLKEYGDLNKETLFKFAQDNLWTGQITFKDTVVCPEYRYDQQSLPDPVVAEDGFIFPVVQYFDGKGTVIWPDSQKGADLKIPDYAK
ncbi:ABC transporter substrate-binding protein [Candidatus Formimonas warabiya]|uniref:ABC transporter substrate-binding protein n=1 Tax=Formimonas warabiya TaxID=1761012 RepID=UPI001BE40BB0|nr:ABC transporter substrate-binding protein [Candidatus Formimonas warabiya]